MISYYFQENEKGTAKWHSYSYWSCFQQWYYWKSYWLGYNQVCTKLFFGLKWQWMLKYQAFSGTEHEIFHEMLMSWTTMPATFHGIFHVNLEKRKMLTWWMMWYFLSGVALRVPVDSKVVVLPSRTSVMTLLKSPHADKKSREQFSRKRWSLIWNFRYDNPCNLGYMTNSSYATFGS